MAKKIIRKLTKRGKYSYYLILPKRIVKAFSRKERQRLELKILPRKKEILIKDYKK
jgi:bifunctional DNA-binding transcriptional regulator/antitoxin component of YhaV-PrlF toxin-antitoxin module